MNVLDILHDLPSLKLKHPVLGGKDPATWPNWFKDNTIYPRYAELAGIIRPEVVLEIGALVGYSLIAMLHGTSSIRGVYWIDNESYVPESNQLCAENLSYYLGKYYTPPRILARNFGRSWFDLLQFIERSQFDLIHIDGAHSFEGKVRDLVVSYALRPKYIILDDYLGMKQVHDAIDFWARSMRKNYFVIFTTNRGITVFDLSGTNIVKERVKDLGLPVVTEVNYG